MTKSRHPLITPLLLAATAILLTWLAVPGVFIIDECNYLTTVHSLQHGSVTLPDTDGLPPSRELLYMAPEAPYWKQCPDPLAASAPPLYAPLALPFAWLAGWRGLVLLNALAFAACLLIVFRRTAALSRSPFAPWLASLTLAAASYLLDYAQGVWPHTLSMFLCTAGFMLAIPVTPTPSRAHRTALAGLLFGLATGIRYQHVVLALLVLSASLLLYPRRLRHAAAFILGALPALAASSAINLARYGSWNPISKPGVGYVALGAVRALEEGRLRDALVDPMRAFASRVIDFSFHHPLPVGFTPEPSSSVGVTMCMGVVKKAWLQSCPWLLPTAILVLLLIRPIRCIKGSCGPLRRQLTAITIAIGGMLMLFAAAGSSRIDGMGFNQRYFIDLLPLAAIALAITAAPRVQHHPRAFAAGAVGATIVALLLILWPPPSSLLRQLGISKLPIVLAALTVVAWLAARYRHSLRPLATALLGGCLAWAMTVHLAEDMPATRRMRHVQALRAHSLQAALPANTPTLLIGTWGCSLAAAPLELSHRGLVIADPWIDGGKDLPVLVTAALASERRVFVILNHLPPDLFAAITHGRQTTWAHRGDATIGDIGLIEILPSP